jgi:hypothetical protein
MIQLRAIAISTMLLATLGVDAQQKDGADGQKTDPASSRELIRQWVHTERIISEERTAWQVEKQQMLDEELNAAGASAELIDENKEQLEARLAQYREARQVLHEAMARLLPRMRKLLVRFPAPLLDELDGEVELLKSPDAIGNPRDVLKSMISVLNAAGRFNRTLTLAEETRFLEDGKKVTVDVLYLGLCRAYFASKSGSLAGVGEPSASGQWSWVQQPEIGDQVRKTIAVYKKSEQPQLVNLPLQLQTGEPVDE